LDCSLLEGFPNSFVSYFSDETYYANVEKALLSQKWGRPKQVQCAFAGLLATSGEMTQKVIGIGSSL
jgi:hypothetical protein